VQVAIRLEGVEAKPGAFDAARAEAVVFVATASTAEAARTVT
jgi:hypothetical protein